MALDERTPEERRRTATLNTEFKPFYKRRSFWLLLLLGLVLGAGFAVAIPFIAPALVMGLVTTLIALTSPVAGWAIIAIVGAVVGLALMAATYALVRGISSKITQYRKEQQAKDAEIVTRHVEGSEAANKIAARITELIREDTPESRQEESALRQKALTMNCSSAAQKAAFYYAALGIQCTVGESKECNESDYHKAYLKLGLRWHPDKTGTDAEFIEIGKIVDQLKNPESNLWKYTGVSADEAAAHAEIERQAALYKQERAERERERETQNRETADLLKRQDERLEANSKRLDAVGIIIAKHSAESAAIREAIQETSAEHREIASQVQDMFATLNMLQQSGSQASSTSATTSKIIHRGPAGGSSENHTAAPPSVPSITSDEEDIIVEEAEHRSSFRFGGKPIGE